MPESLNVELLRRVGCHVYSGEMSADGTYREAFTGPGLDQMLGGPTPDGVDHTYAWNAAVHPDDQQHYQEAGLGENQSVSLEYRLIGRDGVTRWVLDQMWVRETLPDGRRLIDGVVTDVSELHRRSDQVAQATAWLNAAVSVSPAALILMDRDARVTLWNPAAERLFGRQQDQVLGEVAPHMPPGRRADYVELLEAMVAGGSPKDLEEVTVGPDGRPINVSVSSALVRDPAGQVTGFLSVLTDITARKETENRLRQLAHSDPLTGLANRVLITERIDEAVSQPPSRDHGVALLLLDLDGFKAVNDSFGHAVGDELLLAVARRLSACLRSQDIAARLGGDEFAMLLESIDDEEASDVAERILAALAEPFVLRRAHVVVTASIGLVHAGRGRRTEDLLRDADVAMYQAKGAGKNQVVVFEPSMQEQVASRLRMESELRTAVTDGQFVLYYQPFVNLETRRVVGVEALVRWQHPIRGLLPPAEFIPIAEETGLIVALGRWILETACAQAAAWQPADPAALLSIAVNLSPRQLHDPDLIGFATRCLRDSGLPPSALTIEITENLLLTDSALAGARLDQLRALGVQVAVDDFGTGYSSLAYLRRYPVDILKIDRSFVTPLADGPRQAALVRSIIDLAAALDLDTVAEGVERPDQAATLAELGCHVAQGFYFSEPQPVASIEALLARPVLYLPIQQVG
jgi:diguanylate cyclase (GGDEF)-like protein/PAS domain S-box-containing protein